MSNLDNRIANADQLLTQDVEKLSNSIAELYSNLSKVVIRTIYGFYRSLKWNHEFLLNYIFMH